jgi:hypothetical protein
LDQLLNVPFGLVRRTSQKRLSIGLGEVRRKLGDAAQVKTPVTERELDLV